MSIMLWKSLKILSSQIDCHINTENVKGHTILISIVSCMAMLIHEESCLEK